LLSRLITGVNDGKAAGMKDFIVMPYSHSFIYYTA